MTTGPDLDVRGGAGGTAVGLDELVGAAGQLLEAADLLGAVVVRVVATSAEVGASAALSPVTAAVAESELAGAVQAVAVEAAALVGVATAVRSAALAYRAAEDEVARSVALAQDAVMAVAGHAAPSLVVGVVVLDALGVDVGRLLDRAVWHVPALADLAGGSGGLVVGLRSNPLTAPFVVPPQRVTSSPQGRAAAASDADPDERAVGVLADSAAAWGLLRDIDGVQVTPVDDGPAAVRAPAGLADLVGDQEELPTDARVRVLEVHGDQGPAWIVEIPGTQVWDPAASTNPFDVTTDVRSMAAESTLLAAGVAQALAAAQSRAASAAPRRRDVSTEPVLLAGHSLGGIVAAGLASSAEFRSAHRVTHVVALGSPIARAPVPPGVQVLAIEHVQDPVPRLDGRANPDRAGWVTVSRDLEGAPAVEHRASAAHRAEGYVTTAAAVDGSVDPSVTAWRAGAERFFAAPGEGAEVVVRDYRIARVGPAP